MKLSNSQNFINNQKLIDRLISVVDFSESDQVIEIGPGKGIITNSLIKYSRNLIAIEYDKNLFSSLHKKYLNTKNLELIHQNFLKFKLPNKFFIVVANIPFNITADIVRKLTDLNLKMRTAHLIIQKEAAVKYLGAPYAHSPLLSHFLKIHFDISKHFDIDRSNYTPTPNFDTTFIKIKRRNIPLLNMEDEELFKDFLTYTFERRHIEFGKAVKQIMSSLQVKILCKEVGIELDSPIKSILFEQWLEIFKIFKEHSPQKYQNKIFGKYQKLKAEQSKIKKVYRTYKD